MNAGSIFEHVFYIVNITLVILNAFLCGLCVGIPAERRSPNSGPTMEKYQSLSIIYAIISIGLGLILVLTR